MNDETFFKDLDLYSKEKVEDLKNRLKGILSDIFSIDVCYEVPISVLAKYGISNDIGFLLEIRPEKIQSKYLYKNMEIEPEAYYMRPENYNPVSTLEILQEAIKQGTPYPDIKHIENKNNLTNSSS